MWGLFFTNFEVIDSKVKGYLLLSTEMANVSSSFVDTYMHEKIVEAYVKIIFVKF